MDKLDLTDAGKQANYQEIKDYVFGAYGIESQ